MRAFRIILAGLIILTVCVNHAYAGNPLIKLARGALNIATCPLELVNSGGDKAQEKNDMKAFVNIASDRIWRTGKRAIVGAYEVATFLFPIPANYDPIMDRPEFFLGVNNSIGPELSI